MAKVKKHNMFNYDNQDRNLLVVLFIVFIITELIDDAFDHLLGNSVLHSIIQLFLFLALFFIVAKIFLGFYKGGLTKLIPEELMMILKMINDEHSKGILINQSKLRRKLDITKPTMKKRIDSLIELKYIFFEEKGNNKYLKLTKLGESLIR
jgi:hypothetical protein